MTVVNLIDPKQDIEAFPFPIAHTIAIEIRKGTYSKEQIDITQFFNKIGTDENVSYAPKNESRFQVRDKNRDKDRIKRAVNKMISSGDTSKLEPLTVLYYPDTNLYKLLNGNHSAEMAIDMNIFKMDAHVVNYETQLNSSDNEARILGNLLNVVEVEKVGTEDTAIRDMLYAWMDSNIAAGKPPITDPEIDMFLTLFPQISRATFGQWISNHKKVGARRPPQLEWTTPELVDQRQNFKESPDYKDYAIPAIRSLDAWEHTGVAQLFHDCMVDNTNKCLMVFYCSTMEQVEKIENSDIKQNILKYYADLAKTYSINIEETEMGKTITVVKPLCIDVQFLRYE